MPAKSLILVGICWKKKKKRTVRTARNGNGLGSGRVFAYPDPTAGQDPRPGPGPIINQVFSQGLDLTHRASFSRLGPNLAQTFFFKPIKIFCQIQAHWSHIWQPIQAH